MEENTFGREGPEAKAICKKGLRRVFRKTRFTPCTREGKSSWGGGKGGIAVKPTT